ncbi:hypothetical protein T484DRAFT_1855995 [Baffinella frigidus]|nr:hypothetical protein T484DRAFT_1855995 [Cryptophyta sp. CCMP2293]
MAESGRGAGLAKMAWAEEPNAFMTELDRKLQNHMGRSSSAHGRRDHLEPEDVFSRAGTLTSLGQAGCNGAEVDEGAATRASLTSTAPKAAPEVSSASHAPAPGKWKPVVVGTTSARPIISADTRWLRLMGFSLREIRGKSLHIVCGPKSTLKTLTQLLAKATPTPSPPAWLRLYHKNGMEIWFIVRATLLIESGNVMLEMKTLDPGAEDEDEEDPADDPAHFSRCAGGGEEAVRVVKWGSVEDVEQQRFEHRERHLLAVLADAERSFARSVEHVSSPRSPWGKSAAPSSPLARRRVARSDEHVPSPPSSSPRSPWAKTAAPSSPLPRRRYPLSGE